jgi:hypothetical protein
MVGVNNTILRLLRHKAGGFGWAMMKIDGSVHHKTFKQ